MDKRSPEKSAPGEASTEPLEIAQAFQAGGGPPLRGGPDKPDPPVQVAFAPDNKPAGTNEGVPFWIAIRNRQIFFKEYSDFINQVFCVNKGRFQAPPMVEQVRTRAGVDGASYPCLDGWLGHGTNAYDLLKTATEIFLLLHCGVHITPGKPNANGTPGAIPGAEGVSDPADIETLKLHLGTFLGGGRLPYITKVIEQTFGNSPVYAKSPLCDGVFESRVDCPCLLELIWSYWHEEGMLVQSLNALSMRFQNLRGLGARDPLAQLELSPLRPLSSIFWGYVQDEQHRLSLARRSYEYQHEYGLYLCGKAVPSMRPADRRSKFVEALHDLLYRCAVFYREGANQQFIPDPFPLLNGLKDVHLVLSQGAGNQFSDLTFTARVEMLMQQWILARPEIREFLGRRPMVVYDEDWMANADAMKSLMGWSDTSITHFRNLAVFGEEILLSIRWYAWGSQNSSDVARDWANLFRPEIQGYLHAYRAATGVDLTAESRGPERGQAPSILLQRRLDEQRQAAGSP